MPNANIKSKLLSTICLIFHRAKRATLILYVTSDGDMLLPSGHGKIYWADFKPVFPSEMAERRMF